MTIKGNIFRNNLKQFIGVHSLDQINEKHSNEIINFMKMHHDIAGVKEAVTGLPNFIPNARAVLEAMSSTFNPIVQSMDTEVLALKELIGQLNSMLGKDQFSQSDRDKIFDLIDKFTGMLAKQLEKNADLKKTIVDYAGRAGSVLGIFGVIIFGLSIAKMRGESS
jgi:hypothetical protein